MAASDLKTNTTTIQTELTCTVHNVLKYLAHSFYVDIHLNHEIEKFSFIAKHKLNLREDGFLGTTEDCSSERS